MSGSNDDTPAHEPPPAAPSEPKQRYVISQLLSIYSDDGSRAEATEKFSARLESALLPNVDVIRPRGGRKAQADAERKIIVFEADPAELQAKTRELTGDTVIEPELPRTPARAYPPVFTAGITPGAATGAGTGAMLSLNLRDASGAPAPGVTMIARFQSLQTPGLATVAGGVSAADGTVSAPFDPNLWRPALAALEPAGGFWTAIVSSPQSGQTITLEALPTAGPLDWWHLLSGATAYDAKAGAGVRIGVVDSGVGPHPFLDHATPIGAFVDGGFTSGRAAGRDVQTHGTHVSGIIGARPSEGSTAFAGLAPGADLFVARIFSETGGGNQGDVANAVGALSQEHQVDLINMSLTGAPSAIEHDAIVLAWRRGTVCICAAGNQNGSAVGYPAAYPECVAVSALGLANTCPPNAMPAWNLPQQPDRWTATGIFLASFSNVGPQIDVASPGNGIVSTIPARSGGAEAPYADMSGTSMSSPMVTGVLARLLSDDKAWAAMARDGTRAARTREALIGHALNLGLNNAYQGAGMARML